MVPNNVAPIVRRRIWLVMSRVWVAVAEDSGRPSVSTHPLLVASAREAIRVQYTLRADCVFIKSFMKSTTAYIQDKIVT